MVTWHALLPLSDQPHLYAGLGVGVSAEGWLSKNVALGGSLEFTKFIVDDYFDDSALGPGVEGYSVLFLPRLSGALRYAPVDLAKGVYFGVSVDAIGRRVSYNVRTSAEKLSDTTFFAGVTPSVGLRWKALDVGLRYQYVADDDGASFLGLVVGGQVAAF